MLNVFVSCHHYVVISKYNYDTYLKLWAIGKNQIAQPSKAREYPLSAVVDTLFSRETSVPYETDGVIFHTDTLAVDTITVEKEYPGIRISVVVTLDSICQTISMDIGFGDIIIPQPEELDYPILLADFPSTNIMAYSLETVVAEKFQTMIERTTFNSRMKDFFDLYRICVTQSLEERLLQKAICATFNNRGTQYSENHIFFSKEFAQDADLNQRWNAFIKKIKYKPFVSFEEVMINISQWMKPYWNTLKGL